MTASTREAALAALHTALQTVAGVTVLRNEPLPQTVPDNGLLILRDGDPGEPEEMMSPPRDAWRHPNNVEIYIQNGDNAARAASLDTIGQAIATALGADRTLGGAVEHLEWGPPVPNQDAVDGAAAIGAFVLTVYLYYETDAGGLAS